MSSHTKSSLFEGMAALLAQVREHERRLADSQGELALISVSAGRGDETAVACRDELLLKIATIEAHLSRLRAALEEGERQAAEVHRRELDVRHRSDE